MSDAFLIRPGGVNVHRALATGAVLLLVYSVVHVVATGIVVDETVMPAQIITGAVTYPDWHPHGIFYRNAYSLSHYSAAAFYRLWPDPSALSFARNCVFLFLSLFSVYAVTLGLTRMTLWAWVATALVLFEAHLRFMGMYPMFVFPNYYSNGHLGLTSGVLAVGLWLCGARRASACLLGLLPSMHAMLAAPVWIWAALQIAWEVRREGRERLRELVAPAAVGLATSIGLAIVIFVWFYTPAVEPSFRVEGDGPLIREQFRLMTDVHRRPYPFVRFGYLANVVGFLGLGGVAVFLRRAGSPSGQRPSEWSALRSVLIFGAIVWTYVIGAHVFQRLAGWLPDPVLLSMPSRFSNYSAILLVPLTITLLLEALASADAVARRSLAFLFGSLLAAAALFSSGVTPLVDAAAVSNNLLVLIWGTTLGAVAANNPGRARGLAVGAALALAAAFAAFWSSTGVLLYFAGAWFVGLLWCWFGQRPWGRLEPTWEAAYSRVPLALAIVVAVAATNTAAGRTADRFHSGFVRWDMMSEDDWAIDRWLEQHAARDELVLVTLLPRPELQGKTGQPVLFEAETLWLMTYMPRLAPLIGTMARDLYGIDYANPAELEMMCGGGAVSIGCSAWTNAWTRRSPHDWKALSSKYWFRLVLAPSGVRLDLEAVFKGDRWTLYQVR